MPFTITLSQIQKLAPSARSSYREAFRDGQPLLDRFEISATRLRIAHFMAQILHESGALTLQFENLNYSPERLPKVWPKRFQPIGPLNPADFAFNARKLANQVYGGRMGNTGPDDGFTYRGRGLLQLTGRDSYAEATEAARVFSTDAPDFVADPDATISAQWCLVVAASEWAQKGCNAAADLDDVPKVTQRINGGQVGIGSRIEWTKRTRAVWL